MIKTKLKFLLLFIILFNNLDGQSFNRSKESKSNIEKFMLVPFAYAVSTDSIETVTFIEIPFSTLQFIKNGDGFLASYRASISLKDEDGMDLGYNVWNDTIRVSNYTETKLRNKNRKHFFKKTLPIGDKIKVIAELHDEDTRKKGIRETVLELSDYKKRPSILEPIFMLDLPGDWGFQAGKIPTKGSQVREFGDSISIFISGFVKNDDFEISVEFSNSNVNDSLIYSIDRSGNKGYFNHMISIPGYLLNSLKNEFTVILYQNRKTIDKKISFTIYKPGVSSFISNIDLALRQMKYALTNKERNQLKGISKNERESMFYEFWKNRDPTPDTEYNELMEEYYERVYYSNEHFDAWQPGWETDRGMIYILFGPPDEIQRTNPSISTSSLYQVWSYYRLNQQFIFKDQNGFGDFRLETPFLGAGL